MSIGVSENMSLDIFDSLTEGAFSLSLSLYIYIYYTYIPVLHYARQLYMG